MLRNFRPPCLGGSKGAAGFVKAAQEDAHAAAQHASLGINLTSRGRIARQVTICTLLGIAALVPTGAAQATDLVTKAPTDASSSASTTPAVPWLFGDWGGARTALQQQGIDFQLGYASELAYNATGGIRQEATNADQYVAGATFNLDRLFGLHAATFQVTLTERTGRNLSDDAGLGTLQQVQEIFGRGQTIRLTQFWYEQKFVNDLVDWKVGRMTIGEDFGVFPCDFENLTFCGSDIGNLVGNYVFNWPISQWATRVNLTLTGFGYFRVGVYDANPRYLGTQDQVLPVFFPNSTGALTFAELGWQPRLFGEEKLAGVYKFGAWYDTSNAPDVVDVLGTVAAMNPGVPVVEHHGRYGGYISFQQPITHTSVGNPDGGGLSLFLNAVIADDRTATTDSQIAGGVVYAGPLPGRPDDDVAFAVGATHVNNRIAMGEALENALGQGPVAVQGTEKVFELYYTVRPLPGLQIRPNLQYVLDPGGTNQNKNVIVLGLKTVANF
jgi:porin